MNHRAPASVCSCRTPGRAAVLFTAVLAAGCVGGPRATQLQSPATQPAAPTSQPGQTQQNQQSGTANVAGQVDARGWTGLTIEQVIPYGVVGLLLAWLLVAGLGARGRDRSLIKLVRELMTLSHERELQRIRISNLKSEINGGRAAPGARSDLRT